MAVLVNFVLPDGGWRRLPLRRYRSGAIFANRWSEDAHNPEVFPSGVLLLMDPLVPGAHLHWS